MPAHGPSKPAPLVSIVTPVLNGAEYIGHTLRSIQRQTYPNIEHIIIDGGSTDGTLGIVRTFEESRVRWTSGPDAGQSQAINRGLSMARGDIFTWLNCDDLLLPDAVEVVVRAMRENAGADFTYAHSELIDARGDVTKSLYTCAQSLPSYQADGGNIFQGTVFFSRRAWIQCGPLDESLKCAFEYKLFDEFFRRFRGVYIDRKLAQYRIHHESISSRFPERFSTEMALFRGRPRPRAARMFYRLRRLVLNLLDGNLSAKLRNR